MNNYEIVEHKGDEKILAVRIKEGEFGGIIYKYGPLKFEEIPDSDQCTVKFDYYILNKCKEDISNIVGLEEEISNILTDLLQQVADGNNEIAEFSDGE